MQQFKQRTNITGRAVERTKKTDRYLALAKNMAYNSSYEKLRHGAVLTKGGSIINISFNKGNYTSFGTRFRNSSRGHATVHAEIGCILGLARTVTDGTDLYVCRINRAGEFRNSKPCSMCHEALKHVGVKRVYYTTGDNTVEMYKL